MHVAPVGQAYEHAPQSSASVMRFVQPIVGQNVIGFVHAQTPALHATPAPQLAPHAPQLFGSICRVAHCPPQQAPLQSL
jgi:hypothetical protein